MSSTAPAALNVVGPLAEAALRGQISHANAEYALRYLLRADPEVAKVAKRLLRTLTPIAPGLFDAASMAAWATDQVAAASTRQLGLRAGQYLSTHLTSRRVTGDVEWRYGLKPIDPRGLLGAPARGALFNATDIAQGYQAAAHPHSMQNVCAYVDEWLPRFAARELKEGKAELWVTESDRDGALARAFADGYSQLYRIETPGAFGQNELYLGIDPKTARRRYFFAEVQGDSSIATLLHVAGISGAAKANVKVLSDVGVRESSQLISAMMALQPYAGSSHAIVGFKNTVVNELWQRKVLGDHQEEIMQWAGEPVVRTPGLPRHARMKELRGMLDRVMLAPQPPPAADALFEALKSPQLLTSPRPSGNGAMPWDGGTFTVLTAAGQTEKVALLRTPYGDVAGKFVDALSRLGAAHIAVLGTAGGLAPRSEIGQLVIPTAVNDDRGQRHAFANAVAPFLNDGAADRIRENAVTASLSTPLKESLAEIARLRDAGNDAVELELASMVETRLAKAPKLSVVLVVSDVPGSEETIESQAPNALDESVGEALDGVLDSMGVTELLIGRNTAAHSLVFTPRTAAAVVERVEELAAKAGIPLLDRPGFVGREVARLDDATIEQLSLPDDVILEHGKNLGDTLIGLFALARPWEVPGTEGQQRQPEKYLTAEATGFDAFALALDEQRRKYQR